MPPEHPDSQDLARKLADLEARDKFLRQQMPKAQAYIGSCQDMCPEKERYKRLLFSSGVSIFEPNELTMVKEYRRAGADQEEPLPHDLRTIQALEKTMTHLVFNIMNDSRSRTSELALIWYDFLWDRLRAIRKDITQQSICDKAAIRLVECCTRFHVHSCYAMNRVRDFDVDMNKRNLNDCLQMLRQMYNDLKNTGVNCAEELEFQKYDILLHLDEDPLSINITMKTSEHRSDMKFATQVFIAYVNNDYFTFFKLLKQADYMESCILSLYVNKMRLIGMKIIISACTSKQVGWYPVSSIIDTLGFDSFDDLREFANSLEIDMQKRDSKYYLLLKKDLIPLIRDISLHPLRSKILVEDKMFGRSAGEIVYESLVAESSPESYESPGYEPMKYTDEPVMTTQTICRAPILSSSSDDEQSEDLDTPEEPNPRPKIQIQVDMRPKPPSPVVEPLIELPPESPVMAEPLEEIRKRVADTMPAGRFKRFRYQLKLNPPPESTDINHHNSENIRPSPINKFEMGHLEESIMDERRANENFFKLFQSFERII